MITNDSDGVLGHALLGSYIRDRKSVSDSDGDNHNDNMVADQQVETVGLVRALASLHFSESDAIAKQWRDWSTITIDERALRSRIHATQKAQALRRQLDVLIELGAPWQLISKFGSVSKTEWSRQVPKSLRLRQGRPRLPTPAEREQIQVSARQVARARGFLSVADFDCSAWVEISHQTAEIGLAPVWHYISRYGRDICLDTWVDGAV